MTDLKPTRLIFEQDEGTSWTDRTDDLLMTAPPTVNLGMQSPAMEPGVATGGSMSCSMRNGPNALYGAGHWNAATVIGQKFRLRQQHGDELYDDGGLYDAGDEIYQSDETLFYGYLSEVSPIGGPYDARSASLQLIDWIAKTQERRVRLQGILQNVTPKQVIQSVVDVSILKPRGVWLDTGRELFPYAMDEAKDERTLINRQLDQVAKSEFGWVYGRRDGSLVFNQRDMRQNYYRALQDGIPALHGTDAIFWQLAASSQEIRNRCEVTTNPRTVSASAEVIYMLRAPIEINPGQTVHISARYSDPVTPIARLSAFGFETMLAGTHYAFSSTQDGIVGDLNSKLTVTSVPGANTTEFDLTNTHSTKGYVTALQVRALAVRSYAPIVNVVEDAASQDIYDERPWQLGMPYQVSTLLGQSIASSMLSRWKDPRMLISQMVFTPTTAELMDTLLSIDVGRIVWADTPNGGDGFYVVNGISYRTVKDNIVIVTLVLAPSFIDSAAADRKRWLIGVAGYSEITNTSRVGF